MRIIDRKRNEKNKAYPTNRITHVRYKNICQRDHSRPERPFPQDSGKANSFAHIASIPPEIHLAQSLICLGHDGVNNARSLVNRVIPDRKNIVCQGSVFSVGASYAEKFLIHPRFKHFSNHRSSVRCKRSRAAVDRTIRGLHGPQEVKRQDKADLEHPGNEPLVLVIHNNLSCHRPYPWVTKGTCQCEERTPLNYAV